MREIPTIGATHAKIPNIRAQKSGISAAFSVPFGAPRKRLRAESRDYCWIIFLINASTRVSTHV